MHKRKSLYMIQLGLKLALLASLFIALLCVSEALQIEREASQFKSLAYHDFIPDAQRLRSQGRLAEARDLLDFVLAHPELPRQHEAYTMRADIQRQMDSWLEKMKRVGKGALKGAGHNTDEILGAIGADMFAIGDVRDLVIQGWHYVRGEQTDAVLVALSTLGLVTTLVPEVDWAPAFLKVARKTGAMTRRFGEFIVALAHHTKRTRSTAMAMECFRDTATLGKRLGPAEALNIMRFVETQSDLRLVARFAEYAPESAYTTLRVGGRQTLHILEKSGLEHGAEIAIEAVKRGPRGVAMTAAMRPGLFRAHFCVGVGKAAWKGNLRQAASIALSYLGRGTLLGIGTIIALALATVLTWLVAPIVRRLGALKMG